MPPALISSHQPFQATPLGVLWRRCPCGLWPCRFRRRGARARCNARHLSSLLPPAAALCRTSDAPCPPISAVLRLQPSTRAGLGRGSSFSPVENSSCFQIHTGFRGEIKQCPLTSGPLQTKGFWLRWALHFWRAWS